MSSKNRNRASHSPILPRSSQAQLLRDLEAYPHFACKDICDRCPEVYGEVRSSLRGATQQKYRYLKGLKKTRPNTYWKLYSRASVVCPNEDQVKQEEEDEEEPLWSSPTRQEEPEAEEPAALSRHSSWRSSSPSALSFGNREESPSPSLTRDSPFLAMSFRSPSSRKSQVSQESPGQVRTMYATVEEAEECGKFFLSLCYP